MLVFVDNSSGYIWGTSLLAEPVLGACEIDRECLAPPARYVMETHAPRDTSTGYHVYSTQNNLAIDDGQDQDIIDFVVSQEFVCYLRKVNDE